MRESDRQTPIVCDVAVVMRMYSKAEKKLYMREALALSHGALPTCLPNPPVGCVIVRGEHIVAAGFERAW